MLMQILFGHNVKTLHTNIFIRLQFSLRENRQFRHSPKSEVQPGINFKLGGQTEQ